MKKILLLFLFFSAVIAKAQLETPPYLPDEALSYAKTYAVSNSSVKTPVLVMIGTGSYELSEFPGGLTLRFNLQTGMANAWMFVFRDRDSVNTFAYVGALKNPLPLGEKFLMMALPASSIPELPIGVATNLDAFAWINSDVFVQSLKQNQQFNNYMNSNPGAIAQQVALIVNTEIPEFEMNQPYWLISIGKGDTLTPELACMTHAITKQTVCEGITSVPFAEAPILNAFPNPSNGNFSIELPVSAAEVKAIYLVNSEGMKTNVTSSSDLNSNKIQLNCSFSIPGAYFIIVETNNKSYAAPVTINR